jgi:hypothetical protein
MLCGVHHYLRRVVAIHVIPIRPNSSCEECLGKAEKGTRTRTYGKERKKLIIKRKEKKERIKERIKKGRASRGGQSDAGL